MPEDKNANKQFAMWMNSLKPYEQRAMTNEISLACDITYQTVYRWRFGHGRIRNPFIKIINEIAGEEVITS